MRLLLTIVTSLVAGAASATEIKMIAADAVLPMLQQAALVFTKSNPTISVSFETGSGSVIVKRLRDGGQKFDLAATNLERFMELQAEGVAQAVAPLATGVVVVAFKKGEPVPTASTPEELRQLVERAKKVSFSDPALGGALSSYFMGLMKAQGFDQVVLKKAVLTPSGHGADPVERGEAEYGIAQKSEVMDLPHVDFVLLLPNDPRRSTFGVGLVRGAPAAADAQKFLDFLKSDPAMGRLKEKAGLL